MTILFKCNVVRVFWPLFLINVLSLTEINGRSEGRYLVYPPQTDWVATKMQAIMGLGLPMDVDVSTIIGYVIKFNYLLPSNASLLTEPYVRYERSIRDGTQSTENMNNRDVYGSTSSRWEIYRMIATTLQGFKSGKSCFLKAVCQVASVPFRASHGIFSELLQTFFTPSTTREKYLDNTDQEYHAAEEAGKNNPEDCSKIFHECEENILDYFTEITFD